MRKGVHAQVVVDDDVYSKKKKWKIFLWIAAGVVVIFGGLFGGMYYYFSHMQDNDTSSDDNRGGDVAVEQDVDQAVDYATQDVIVEQHGTSHDDAVQQHDAVAEKVPVILYFEQISEETKRHRAWPTVRIFRKVGSGNPEMLADVGKIGEYPSGFLMSPDLASS